MTGYQFFPGEWLMRTAVIQRESYGLSPAFFDPEARAAYFREMAFALVVELGELSNEVGWKSWGTDRTLNRANYLKESVDVLHFIANLMVLAGITDKELNEAYNAKYAVNQARMATGTYDGRVENKCISCKRSFDDVKRATGDICVHCI